MKSLQRQLALGLLLAFTLLLGAGGVMIYFSVRGTLAGQFDGTLLTKAVAIASSVKLDRGNVECHVSDHVAHGISAPSEVGLFQLWVVGGKILNRSQSLGGEELPKTSSVSASPKFFDATLPDGMRARGVGFVFEPDSEVEPGGGDGDADDAHNVKPAKEGRMRLGLAVAMDRRRLDTALNTLMVMVAAICVLLLAAAIGSVQFLLRRGLRPLQKLAEETRSVNAGSLQTRFEVESMPEELQPIGVRLNDLLARLEMSFTDISEYASKVTHELRTPLAILRLKIEQAAGKLSPDFAEELQAEIQQLTYVVEQSLFIAKAEQGRLILQARPFDLAALVDDLAEDFSLLAEEEHRRVVVKKVSTELPVRLDPKYTRQIVHNLLSNALKHGRGDVRVVLGRGANFCQLTILNRMRADAPLVETLGMGLRVVDSLLQLQHAIKFRRRQGRAYYAVKLVFPMAENTAAFAVHLGQGI